MGMGEEVTWLSLLECLVWVSGKELKAVWRGVPGYVGYVKCVE